MVSMQAVAETFDNNLDVGDVTRLLDTKNHPDHLSGLKSKAALLREFREAMASDEVMWPAFAAYHRSVAACVTDSQFDLMVRSKLLILGVLRDCSAHST